MKQLLLAAQIYTMVGLISGLFYRELTKSHDFTGDTELSVVHTHLFALGTLFLLIVLALEKQFELSKSETFRWFFWVYNVGLTWTVTVMTIIGSRTVLGNGESKFLAIMAGVGHITITAGFVLFFVCLRPAVLASSDKRVGPADEQSLVARPS
ncbi:DUF2871 domain-containing protein [Nocardia sp. NPDC055053]